MTYRKNNEKSGYFDMQINHFLFEPTYSEYPFHIISLLKARVYTGTLRYPEVYLMNIC